MELLSVFNRNHLRAMRKYFGDKYEPHTFYSDVDCPHCGAELKCDLSDDFDGVPFDLDDMSAEVECPACDKPFKLSVSWLPVYEAEAIEVTDER